MQGVFPHLRNIGARSVRGFDMSAFGLRGLDALPFAPQPNKLGKKTGVASIITMRNSMFEAQDCS
jgi:hypothetical protein